MDLAAWSQELRRRRVIRALLGWGLLSFAVLQVIEPPQHALGLGEQFLKVVVTVLALGFPVTAGLAWAFDLTRTSGMTGLGRGIRSAQQESAARRQGCVRYPVDRVQGELDLASTARAGGRTLDRQRCRPPPDGQQAVVPSGCVERSPADQPRWRPSSAASSRARKLAAWNRRRTCVWPPRQPSVASGRRCGTGRESGRTRHRGCGRIPSSEMPRLLSLRSEGIPKTGGMHVRRQLGGGPK
jgi:hypothetical protein